MGQSRTKFRLKKAITKNKTKRFARMRTLDQMSSSETDEVLDEGGPRFEISYKSKSSLCEKDLPNSDTDEEEWAIEQVMIGDGTKTSSSVLRKGRIYACGSSSTQKDLQNFFEIEEDSLGLHHVRGHMVTVQGRYVTPKGIRENNNNMKTVLIDTEKLQDDGSAGFTDGCLNYLKSHPGFSIRVNFPGRRPPCRDAQDVWMKEKERPFCFGEENNCIISASVNVVFQMFLFRTKCIQKSTEAAKRAMDCFENHREPLYTVGSVTPVFQKMKLCLDVKKFPSTKYDARSISILQGEKFLLVRLLAKKKSDHVVCVDIPNRMVIDSVERFPLRLCEESLAVAGGGKRMKPKVIEVRQVYFTPKFEYDQRRL